METDIELYKNEKSRCSKCKKIFPYKEAYPECKIANIVQHCECNLSELFEPTINRDDTNENDSIPMR
ncbi:MAG: hypothetical protein KAS04_03085 [Candidatus Aenigmarchaeota archaeon]|nr:hypothetical protein [Candidatus Aenigmarchaeota archaeon]